MVLWFVVGSHEIPHGAAGHAHPPQGDAEALA